MAYKPILCIIYNYLNIYHLFFRSNKMGVLKGFLLMAIGAYGGIYACQNYNVPRVDDPQALLERIKEYLKQYEKPK